MVPAGAPMASPSPARRLPTCAARAQLPSLLGLAHGLGAALASTAAPLPLAGRRALAAKLAASCRLIEMRARIGRWLGCFPWAASLTAPRCVRPSARSGTVGMIRPMFRTLLLPAHLVE